MSTMSSGTPMNGRVTTIRGRGTAAVAGPASATAASSGSGNGGNVTQRGVGGSGGVGGSNRRGSGNPVGEMARRLSNFETRLSLMEMGARAGQISFTSLLDGDMRAYDLLGELKMVLGKQTDGKWGVTYVNGPPPSKPSKPLVSARQLGYVVGWDGTFADGLDKPSDLARVDVHVSAEGPDFVPSQATAQGSIFAEGATPMFGNIQTYWVKLVAVTIGDVPSPPSDAVDVRPLPASALAAEVISGIHFAGEIFMGSTFVAGDPAKAHAEWNASGLALYREDQTPTVVFSTDEGNALITGSIQTALKASGKSRIVFNPFPGEDWNEIRFFSPGDTKWASIFASRDSTGADGALTLQGFNSPSARFRTVLTLGEDGLVLGRAQKSGEGDSFPLIEGLAFGPGQTALVGVSGPLLVSNYDSTGDGRVNAAAHDPIICWVRSIQELIRPDSVIEFKEFAHELHASKQLAPAIRNFRNDVSVVLGSLAVTSSGGPIAHGVSIRGFSGQSLAPLFCSGVNTSSGRDGKTDIETMSTSGLDVVNAVEAKQFRRIDGSGTPIMQYGPDVAPMDDALVAAEVSDARKRRRKDGSLPLGRRTPHGPRPLQYGLIAEDIETVAPVAVLDCDGQKLINDSSLDGIMWSAIRELSQQNDALRERLATLEGNVQDRGGESGAGSEPTERPVGDAGDDGGSAPTA